MKLLTFLALAVACSVSSAGFAQGPNEPRTKTVWEEVQQEYEVYNPATGQTEVRVRTIKVPVTVMVEPEDAPVPPQPPQGLFAIEFVNNLKVPTRITLGDQFRMLQPGQRISAMVSEGQLFTYTLPQPAPRIGPDGQAIPNAINPIVSGKATAARPTVYIGGGRPEVDPKPPVGGPLSPVTFQNGRAYPVTVTLYDRNGQQLGQTVLQPQAEANAEVPAGSSYEEEAPRELLVEGANPPRKIFRPIPAGQRLIRLGDSDAPISQ